MRKIVTISYTPRDAPGGVPRWNRDFNVGIPCTHFSWWDALPAVGGVDRYDIPEWDKARVLNQYLIWSKKISKDDIILVDGFWGLGLESFPNVVSVAHGNWSHTTFDDVQKGIPPEFPDHHRVQLRYRQDHLTRGGRIVAVSEFIAHQCKLQWGFEMPVINNGIDLDLFNPMLRLTSWADTRLIVHGTTTANKGLDHIDLLKSSFPNDDVLLLDDATRKYKFESNAETLANADLVVHPSAHEGNSYFLLEALASGTPVVTYDVGLMYEARNANANVGVIVDRTQRNPMRTIYAVDHALENLSSYRPRDYAELHSVQKFQEQWRTYLEMEFGYEKTDRAC